MQVIDKTIEDIIPLELFNANLKQSTKARSKTELIISNASLYFLPLLTL